MRLLESMTPWIAVETGKSGQSLKTTPKVAHDFNEYQIGNFLVFHEQRSTKNNQSVVQWLHTLINLNRGRQDVERKLKWVKWKSESTLSDFKMK